MRIKKLSSKIIVLSLLFVFAFNSLFTLNVNAQTGKVFTAKVNRSYSHPITNVIEDSGGSSATATAQGMIDGVVNNTGILEVTDSGEYYLTIRMSLMDFTENHQFQVQNVNDNSWQTMSMGVTATGSDNNGTTADITVQLPSENSVVRVSMHVTPMGRDVIFYVYPNNYVEGNSTGMIPTIVDAPSQSNVEVNKNNNNQTTTLQKQEPEKTQTTQTPQASQEEVKPNTENNNELDNTKGLSLSTEKQVSNSDSEGSLSNVNQIIIMVLLILIVCLVLFVFWIIISQYIRRKRK